ncbi:lipocalin family protein [Streptomyces sp. NPDC048142]|uniref:lipocalin family protein n=1 Tax=Streptomyces sp. NPDC048142 TaxID=3365501 RepID=UPI00371F6ACF
MAGHTQRSCLTPSLLASIRATVSGDEAMDARVRTAPADVLAEGPPLPDELLRGQVRDLPEKLDLVLGDHAALREEDDGSYTLGLRGEVTLEVNLLPQKEVVPQFDADGHPPGRLPDGTDAVTSHFVPRLATRGRLRLPDGTWQPAHGMTWFEQDWGGSPYLARRERGIRDHSWSWGCVQLDNGWDISSIRAEHTDPATENAVSAFAGATAVAPDGTVSYHTDITWETVSHWTSLATLETYPTALRVSVPSLALEAEIAGTDGHEIRTILKNGSLCECPATVSGTMGGAAISGAAHLESMPSSTVGDVERHMRRISHISITEAAAVYPAAAPHAGAMPVRAAAPVRPGDPVQPGRNLAAGAHER